MGSVDVILNPHRPNNGVFPFKLTEAVGSGRLVITSPVQLAEELSWISDALLQLELKHRDWLDAITGAHSHYVQLQAGIELARRIVKDELSLSGVGARVQPALL
mgnify:FL=1